MSQEDLEKVLSSKIKPMIDSAVNKYLGITVNELSTDITDKLRKTPLLDFDLDSELDFKTAKSIYIQKYLMQLLQTNHGNISKVASIADVDRRTIHRLIKKHRINVVKLREDPLKPYYVRQSAVSTMIEKSLDTYKQVIKSDKLNKVYKNVDMISKEILKELPIEPMTLKEAEHEFERKFIKTVLKKTKNNISQAAKLLGLRFETLHRKIQKLNIYAHA